MTRSRDTANTQDNIGGAVPPFVAGKNVLINGGMDIWQRGTSFTATGYGADRWYLTVSGTCTFAQETSVIPTGARYALKWTTGAGSSYGQVRQFIEQAMVIPLRGQTLTASAMVQLGTGFSGTLTWEIYYSTTTDTVTSFSGSAVTISSTSGTPVIGSYTKMTATFTVPSNAVGLYIGIVPTVVQNSGVTAYHGNIQLELGSIATPFARTGGTIQGELAACQRYYFREGGDSVFQYLGAGSYYNTTNGYVQVMCPVTMRTAPSSIDYSTLQMYDFSGTQNVTALSLDSSSRQIQLVGFTIASGGTQFRPTFLRTNNSTSGYIGFSAEL